MEQYTGWPDHGKPTDTLPVLSFGRKSVGCNPPGGGAFVAQCSAGVGRTGTYTAIDAMLRQATAKGGINVVSVLKHLRGPEEPTGADGGAVRLPALRPGGSLGSGGFPGSPCPPSGSTSSS